ncbi:hypothetical protein Hdeb2414_s0006g00201011 [Helianthus debilis subsp. tardiflorus]
MFQSYIKSIKNYEIVFKITKSTHDCIPNPPRKPQVKEKSLRTLAEIFFFF